VLKIKKNGDMASRILISVNSRESHEGTGTEMAAL
jgi:hypothetical protein